MLTSTLLVSTYNWPAALELVLMSALAQDMMPTQIVVADDGSADDTRTLIERFVPRFAERGTELRHVWHEDRGFRLTAIRNRALAESTGEYVLMIDGDCVLHPAFVRTHLRFARRGTFVQGSRVLMMEARTRRAIERKDIGFTLFGRGFKNRQNALSLRWLSHFVPTPQDPLHGTRGCNMAYWRDDAVRINGFNERFVGWGREDSEFSARLLAAGLRRRKLKFGGIVFHLWHRERPRSAVDENHRLFEEIVRRRASWCEEGLDQYLRAERVGAGGGTD